MTKSAKGDIKLLVTGVISLILAVVFAIITVTVVAFQLAQKAGETDWNALWTQVQSGFNNVIDDIEIDDIELK